MYSVFHSNLGLLVLHLFSSLCATKCLREILEVDQRVGGIAYLRNGNDRMDI